MDHPNGHILDKAQKLKEGLVLVDCSPDFYESQYYGTVKAPVEISKFLFPIGWISRIDHSDDFASKDGVIYTLEEIKSMMVKTPFLYIQLVNIEANFSKTLCREAFENL
jgi:hypothetical protein